MIRTSGVNEAMIQHAAGELEVGVPIRSWRVEAGELVLLLAYGGEARWKEAKKEEGRRKKGEGKRKTAPASTPWRFDEPACRQVGEKNLRSIPDGDLSKLTKRELQLILLSHGYQTETLNPLKAEFVEALTWLRERE